MLKQAQWKFIAGQLCCTSRCLSAEGGHHVGNTAIGEFLTYTISVPETGTYDIRARVSATNDQSFIIFSFDGVDSTGEVAIPNTGGPESWSNIKIAEDVPLSQGVHQLRMDPLGNFNLDNFTVGDLPVPSTLVADVQGSATAPTVSNSDLAQTAYLSSSGVSPLELSTQHQELFNVRLEMKTRVPLIVVKSF